MKLQTKIQFCIYFVVATFLCGNASGQSWDVDGFVTEMPSLTWSNNDDMVLDNLIHNRFNINRNFNNGLSLDIGLRNRFLLGGTIKNDATYKYILASDPGVVDLSVNIFSGKGYVLNSHIDRLTLSYDIGKVNTVVGRQRVEWGRGRVWNPNDIFNVYSFYDFDYRAKPGMDGVSVSFGNSDEARVDAVIKVDGNYDMTAALRFQSQIKALDFQLLSGLLNQSDYVFGFGWSYSMNHLKLFNETSIFATKDDFSSTNALVSLGAYYQKEKVRIGLEYLYSEFQQGEQGNIEDLFYGRTSIKNLSVSEHSYNLSFKYDFTENFNSELDLIGFGYPLLQGGYLSSITNYSIKSNLQLSSIIQYYNQDWMLNQESKGRFSIRLKKYF
ncbi:hypothetical protein [Labilibacter marinus]|uniref:hypothetical protein n=1 Tax=Labilibacter marinus TaxID=1477105 RepID=UPI00094FFE48|nr:hypothetical protein [Labilibacter marinus]